MKPYYNMLLILMLNSKRIPKQYRSYVKSLYLCKGNSSVKGKYYCGKSLCPHCSFSKYIRHKSYLTKLVGQFSHPITFRLAISTSRSDNVCDVVLALSRYWRLFKDRSLSEGVLSGGLCFSEIEIHPIYGPYPHLHIIADSSGHEDSLGLIESIWQGVSGSGKKVAVLNADANYLNYFFHPKYGESKRFNGLNDLSNSELFLELLVATHRSRFIRTFGSCDRSSRRYLLNVTE